MTGEWTSQSQQDEDTVHLQTWNQKQTLWRKRHDQGTLAGGKEEGRAEGWAEVESSRARHRGQGLAEHPGVAQGNRQADLEGFEHREP